MAGEIDLLTRLLAYERRRAVRVASHRQVAIRPDALVVCPVAMAGEDTTVHAIALGSLGKRAEVFIVPDPRVREAQFQLFEWFGDDEDFWPLAERAERDCMHSGV